MPSSMNLKMSPSDHRLIARLIEISAGVCLSIDAQNGAADGDALAARLDLSRRDARALLPRLRDLNLEFDFGVRGL